MVRKSKELKEATDMTGGGAYQDIVAPPRKEGDPTGQTTAIENQISAVGGTPPVDSGPIAARGPIPQPVSLSAPTQRPSEPITTGIPLGPGSNGPEPIVTNTVDNFLMAARQVFPDPIFDQLLDS